MRIEKNRHLQSKTEEILKDMLEMLRGRKETGVELHEFIDYLQNKKKRTTGTETKEWNPVDRSKERTVFRYIKQLTRLGCDIDYKNSSKTFVLRSREWQFPISSTDYSPNSIMGVLEILSPILKDIPLTMDILNRFEKGMQISVNDKVDDEIRKTVVSAWAKCKVLMIKYGRGSTPKELTIEPHGLVFHNSEWQIAAMERGKAKAFSLSKIVEAYLSEKHFDFKPEVLTEALRENGKDKTEEKQEDK